MQTTPIAVPNVVRVAASLAMQRRRGFTLIEILVVLLLIAVGTATVSLALRDSDARTLEHEAARLVALLEGARAESRAAGMVVRWLPMTSPDSSKTGASAGALANPKTGSVGGVGSDLIQAPQAPHFQFTGLPTSLPMPSRWLFEGTQAQVLGASQLLLGPEAILPPQRLVLSRGNQRLEVASDGLAPFAVVQAAEPVLGAAKP